MTCKAGEAESQTSGKVDVFVNNQVSTGYVQFTFKVIKIVFEVIRIISGRSGNGSFTTIQMFETHP